jgi:acyl phosphate:glycerol-3-phosphate acyltransferase
LLHFLRSRQPNIGVLLALVRQAAFAFGVILIAVAAATRYSSLAALVASAATPVILWFMGYPPKLCCS